MVNWELFVDPMKKLVKVVMKFISCFFFMMCAFLGIAAAGIMFSMVIGTYALFFCTADFNMLWIPVCMIGSIVTSVALFKSMTNTAGNAFIAIFAGIFWPITVTVITVWIGTCALIDGIDRLKQWCGYYES